LIKKKYAPTKELREIVITPLTKRLIRQDKK